jgi:antitoxin component of MazEF toxin-antitoxin module
MRALQKLVRNGNSTQFTIPRPVLIHLGWIAGETMMLEVLEDDRILIRRPRGDDFGATLNRSSRVVNADGAA